MKIFTETTQQQRAENEEEQEEEKKRLSFARHISFAEFFFLSFS